MKKILIAFVIIVFISDLFYGEQNLRLCINASHQKDSPYYAYNCAVFSSDGKILATAGSHCNLWDYQSGILLRTIGYGSQIRSVSFTHDGKKIILGGEGDAAIKVFDVATGKLLSMYKNYLAMNCRILAVSPDDTYTAADVYEAGGMCKWYMLVLFNLETGEDIRVGQDSDGPYFFSEDGRYFYFSSKNELKCMSINEKKILDDCSINEQNSLNHYKKEIGCSKNRIYIYSPQDKKPDTGNTVYEHDTVIRKMQHIPQTGQCAFIDKNNTFFMLDIEKSMVICKIDNIEPAQMLFNPHDGNVLVLNKDVINIINIEQNKVTRRIGANTFKPCYIDSCAVCADGTCLAYNVGTSKEPAVSIFALDSLKVERQFKPIDSTGSYNYPSFLFGVHEDIYFVKMYAYSQLKIWNSNSNMLFKEFNNVKAYAVVPALNLIFTAEYSNDYKQSSICLYSLPDMSCMVKFPLRYEDKIVVPIKIAASGDGTEFIIAYSSSGGGPGGYTCTLLHGNVLRGCVLKKICEKHVMFLKDIVFTSKKRLAAFCYKEGGNSDTGKAVIININTKKTVFSTEECTNIRFSPDESLCAVTNATDNIINVYETTGWKLKYSLDGNESCQRYMIFSPDSRYLLTCGNDSKIKTFDMRSGKLTVTLYIVDGGNFIIYTPDCYFMCSDGMKQYISVFKGDTLIKDSEILKKLHNPRKIALLFADIAKSFGKNSLYSFRIGRCNETSVRIRKGPDLSSKIIGMLQKDQLIVILGRSTSKMRIDDMEAYWYNIKTESGVTGWSYGYFIDYLESE